MRPVHNHIVVATEIVHRLYLLLIINRGTFVLQQQLQAYVAWVNSQLKKKPGTRSVEDLRCDMQDGVALADLIEIVGKLFV